MPEDGAAGIDGAAAADALVDVDALVEVDADVVLDDELEHAAASSAAGTRMAAVPDKRLLLAI